MKKIWSALIATILFLITFKVLDVSIEIPDTIILFYCLHNSFMLYEIKKEKK